MHVERLYEDSHYQVTGELQINSISPGQPNHVHGGSRLNLTSSESRRRLAKYLEEIWPNAWTQMLEQATVLVLAEWRKGAPIIELAKHTVRDSLGMRVHPLLQERQATVFYGEGDTLKSFMALFLAVIVRNGTPQAGLTPEPGNVLYLDYETDEDTMWERAELIRNGLGIDMPEGLYYRYMHQPLAGDIQHLNRLVLDKGINLVIVDSAAPAVLEPESASITAEYFRALRSLGVTSLTIAHVAKNAKATSPFGSTFWKNLPRSTFHVQASREPEHVTIGLKHTKSNNGRRLPDLGFQFEFDDQRLLVSKADVQDVPDLATEPTLLQSLHNALSHGLMSAEDVTREIYGSEWQKKFGVVKFTLSHYKDRFVNPSRGMWGLLKES